MGQQRISTCAAQLSTAQHSSAQQRRAERNPTPLTAHRSPLTDQRVSAPSPSVTSIPSLFTTISECLHGLFYLNSIYIPSESTPPNKSRSLPSAESPNMPPRPKENVSTMVSHTFLALSAPSSPVSPHIPFPPVFLGLELSQATRPAAYQRKAPRHLGNSFQAGARRCRNHAGLPSPRDLPPSHLLLPSQQCALRSHQALKGQAHHVRVEGNGRIP